MKLSLCIIIPFVVALSTSSCSTHNKTPEAGQLNDKASFTDVFNFNKMGLEIITSTINKKTGTMSTLYGNDSARLAATEGKLVLVPGVVLALVTWKQQPDKRWIGGNIPGDLLSLEIVKPTINQNNATVLYNRFLGKNLQKDIDTTANGERVKFILGLKPSIFF